MHSEMPSQSTRERSQVPQQVLATTARKRATQKKKAVVRLSVRPSYQREA